MRASDVTPSVVAKIRDDIASAKARGLQTMLPGDAVESILDALEHAWKERDAARKLVELGGKNTLVLKQRLEEAFDLDKARQRVPPLSFGPEENQAIKNAGGSPVWDACVFAAGYNLARDRALYPKADGGST